MPRTAQLTVSHLPEAHTVVPAHTATVSTATTACDLAGHSPVTWVCKQGLQWRLVTSTHRRRSATHPLYPPHLHATTAPPPPGVGKQCYLEAALTMPLSRHHISFPSFSPASSLSPLPLQISMTILQESITALSLRVSQQPFGSFVWTHRPSPPETKAPMSAASAAGSPPTICWHGMHPPCNLCKCSTCCATSPFPRHCPS